MFSPQNIQKLIEIGDKETLTLDILSTLGKLLLTTLYLVENENARRVVADKCTDFLLSKVNSEQGLLIITKILKLEYALGSTLIKSGIVRMISPMMLEKGEKRSMSLHLLARLT